jgi:hypothetical protein
LRAGMPGDFGGPVVTNSCVYYHLHTRLRVHRHPAFPTPSFFQGERFKHNSGAPRRGIADVRLSSCLKPESEICASMYPVMVLCHTEHLHRLLT